MTSGALLTTSITSLPLLHRGKVRDNYAVGPDRLLMIATDRISAFDVVMNEAIPDKGRLLTQISRYWFRALGDVVPNHLLDQPLDRLVSAEERAQVEGRAMLVERLQPVPVESVVRGYLAGSAWAEYRQHGTVCGAALPPGLKDGSKLPTPIFTPATKAAAGEHDENITTQELASRIGATLAHRIEAVSLELYNAASAIAAGKGIIVADTKFEFGLDKSNTLTLMDEVLTPDSSRFWKADAYHAGERSEGLDKQFFRDWLEQPLADGNYWNKCSPPPALPPFLVNRIADVYREACDRLTS